MSEALKRAAELASGERLTASIAEYRQVTGDADGPSDWDLEFWHAGYKHGALAVIDALAAHDAEVTARALDDAAAEVRAQMRQAEFDLHQVSTTRELSQLSRAMLNGGTRFAERLSARADAIRTKPTPGTNGAELESPEQWWACAVNAPRPEWVGSCDCDLSRAVPDTTNTESEDE